MKQKLMQNPIFIKILLNIWPPFLFSGIKILELSKDFKYCKVKLKNWPGTRNANGTQFGGSLFSMTDPIYSLMFMGLLGKKYHIWDKDAHINFKSPGVGAVYVECNISDEMLNAVYQNTKDGEKYFPVVKNTIKDREGTEVAEVTKTIYIRLKRQFRPPQ